VELAVRLLSLLAYQLQVQVVEFLLLPASAHKRPVETFSSALLTQDRSVYPA